MDFLTQLFKSVANERRLQMLELLLDGGEIPIEEIASRLRFRRQPVAGTLKYWKGFIWSEATGEAEESSTA